MCKTCSIYVFSIANARPIYTSDISIFPRLCFLVNISGSSSITVMMQNLQAHIYIYNCQSGFVFHNYV